MLISIIIPVYNVEQYIIRCLQSVVAQKDLDKIEVIIVDDCGTDNSIALAKEFLVGCSGLDYKILHHAKNGGLSAARNTGLRAAKGDYVYFLDSDDEITANCIRQLAAPLKDGEYDFVIGDYTTTLGDGASMLQLQAGAVVGNERVFEAYVNGLWYVMAWNKLCRREFLLQNALLFEEGLLHEDVIWSFKLACKAVSMYVVKEPVYIYSIREASIMTGMSIEKDLSIYVKAFDVIANFIREEKREMGRHEYIIFQGKRAGIMYSLLQKGEVGLYRKYYSLFKRQCYVSPWRAWRAGVISAGYLLRDLHYLLPGCLGRAYMRLFYILFYKMRNKKIEGAVWN